MIFVFPDDCRAIKCSAKSPKRLENNITAVQKHRPESPGYKYVHTQGSETRDSLISLCITVIFLKRLFTCTCLTALFKHVQQRQQVKKAKKQKCDCTHRAQINPTLDAVRIYLYTPPHLQEFKVSQGLSRAPSKVHGIFCRLNIYWRLTVHFKVEWRPLLLQVLIRQFVLCFVSHLVSHPCTPNDSCRCVGGEEKCLVETRPDGGACGLKQILFKNSGFYIPLVRYHVAEPLRARPSFCPFNRPHCSHCTEEEPPPPPPTP